SRILAEAAVSRTRRAVARSPARRDFRLPGSQWRRKDDDAEAAHAADFSDLRTRGDSRTAGWRRRPPPANRLPSRESLLLRLPDGRRAPAILRELVRLLTLRGTHPCCPTPGPRRHRCRTPPPAAPQVF